MRDNQDADQWSTVERKVFLLGAAKSGTTTLAGWLSEQSGVLLSHPKEPLFISAEFERGVDFYWSRYFAPRWKGEPVVVDASHRSLYLPFAPARIAQVASSPRLVVILRDPVERAYSHWRHRSRAGIDPLSFEDALEKDRQRLEAGLTFEGPSGPGLWASSLGTFQDRSVSYYRTYLDSGHYAVQIRRYIDLFGEAALKTLFLEDLSDDPSRVLGDLATFLGIEADPSTLRVLNDSADKVELRGRSVLGRAGARRIRSLVPKPLRRRFRGLVTTPVPSSPMTTATRRDLDAYYADLNRDLEAVLGRAVPESWDGSKRADRVR